MEPKSPPAPCPVLPTTGFMRLLREGRNLHQGHGPSHADVSGAVSTLTPGVQACPCPRENHTACHCLLAVCSAAHVTFLPSPPGCRDYLIPFTDMETEALPAQWHSQGWNPGQWVSGAQALLTAAMYVHSPQASVLP